MGSIVEKQILEEDYQRWRMSMFTANLIFAGAIFFMESAIFFVLKAANLINISDTMYMLKYLLFPTTVNSLILGIGYWLMKKTKSDNLLLNYVPLIQMTLMCLVLTIVHHVFLVTFATYCFPIFISVIFRDKKMTRRISGLCLVCLTIMHFVGPLFDPTKNDYHFSSYLIAMAIVLCANVLCNVMMQYEKQKDQRMKILYYSRMDVIEQLKYDQKTGLHGHTSIQTGLKRMVDEAEMANRPAVAMLDIDDFKKVNDTYGHVKGDIVILEVARILREACGDKYTAARYGGEEFAILFQNGTIDDYIRTVEKVRKTMEKTLFDFRKEPITLSVGIAIWEEGWGTTEFFDRADEALYISKRQGKNRTTICDGDIVKSAALYQLANAREDNH